MFNDLVQKYNQILAPTVNKGLSAIGNEVHALPQQLGSLGQGLVKAASSQPLINIPNPIGFNTPTQKPIVGPTLGQYVQGQYGKPAQTLIDPKAHYTDKLMAGVQLGFNTLSPLASTAYNVVGGGAAGALKTIREGGDLNKNISQSIANPSDIAGTGLGVKNPLLAMGIDLAAGNPKAVLKNGKTLVQGLKGYSPNAFNIHPQDQEIMADFVNAVQTGRHADLKGQLSKDAQVLAEHYIGEKARNISNQKLAQAFDALLSSAAKNRGEDVLQTPFPKMGLAANKDISSEGVIKKNQVVVKNIPTQTELKNRAEVNAGNPDLYTQRQAKIANAEKTPIVGQPTAKEKVAIEAMDRLVGDKSVQDKLAGGKYKIDNGMGAPANPKPKVKMPFGETKNKVDLSIKGNTDKEKVLSAIANSERTKNSITLRGKDAYIAGQKLSRKDRALVDQYQEGQPISELAKKAENPKAFTEFMNKMTDYYDYRLATDRALGGATNRRENYIHQYWDLSNPQDLQRFNQLAKQKGLQTYKGFSAQPRVFNTYAEGEAAGFKRLYPSAVEDLQQDYVGASHSLSKRTLQRGLELGVPDKISEAGKGFTENGKPFINSNIPGMEGVSLHPDVHNMLKGFEPVKSQDLFTAIKEHGLEEGIKSTGAWDSFWSLYDHASQPMKQFLLNFSGFHSINISANFAGEGLFSPLKGTRGLAQSIPSFFSEGATQKIIQSFKNKIIPGRGYSVYEAGLRSGQKMDRGLPATGLKRLNVFGGLQRAIFDRELYTLRLNLNDMVFGDGKIDPESPQGINAGKEIDKVLGAINTKTMNINPNSMKWASRVFLAPQFTVSKYSTLKDTATASSTQRALALKAVFGKSLVLGSLSTLGTLLATGQLPTLQQILTNFTTDPEIQTNLTNPKGKKQDIALPNSFVSEPLRPVLGGDGLINGSTVGLQHYGQARLNPMLTNGAKLLPGAVDYYGNPIVDSGSTKSVPEQLVQNVGVGMLPIGAQNIVNAAQGKITPTQAGINIIGLRTHTSPNDPTAQYFKAKDAEYQKLTPTQRTLVDAIPKQDPTDPGAKQLKYELIGRDPAVWNYFKNIAIADSQGDPNKVDPLYRVPYAQAKAYILYEAQNPGSADKKALYKANPVIGQIAALRSVYFQNNPLPNSQPSGAPVASARAQALMNAGNFKDPEVQAYLNANTAYNNSLRSQMGLTPIQSGYSHYARKPKLIKLHTPKIVKAKLPKIKQVKQVSLKIPKVKFSKVTKVKKIKSLT